MAFIGDGGETASAAQPVEPIGVDDTRHPAPFVVFPPIQELLPGLRAALYALLSIRKTNCFRLKLTPGNVDDRKPMLELCQGLFGQLFADQGNIARWLAETLAEHVLQLITALKKNIKPILRTDFDKAILRRRSLIETVFDELKNLCQIQRTRHRSHFNFAVNLMVGITACCLTHIKPMLFQTRVNLLHSA